MGDVVLVAELLFSFDLRLSYEPLTILNPDFLLKSLHYLNTSIESVSKFPF